MYFIAAGMCLEKRAFYRVISGLHASINVHLSAIYITNGELQLTTSIIDIIFVAFFNLGQFSENPKFGPNFNAFVHRFDMTTTSNQGNHTN